MIRIDIAGLADIHGDIDAVRKVGPDIAQAHAVLLVGDITHFGTAREAAEIVDTLARYNTRILAIPGNCDPPEVAQYLADRGVSLQGRRMIIDGVGFIGVGASLPCPGRTPNEVSEKDLKTALYATADRLPLGSPMVLVCHQPPYDTATDVVAGGTHVGSKSVREFIRDRQPLLCFTGHIHESRAIDTIGRCHVINPGPLREGQYAWAMIGETVHGQTVMAHEIRRIARAEVKPKAAGPKRSPAKKRAPGSGLAPKAARTAAKRTQPRKGAKTRPAPKARRKK